MKIMTIPRHSSSVKGHKGFIITSDDIERFYAEDIESDAEFVDIQHTNATIRYMAKQARLTARSDRQDLSVSDAVLNPTPDENGIHVYKYRLCERIMFDFYFYRPPLDASVIELTSRQVHVFLRILKSAKEVKREGWIYQALELIRIFMPKLAARLMYRYVSNKMTLVMTERAITIMAEREEYWNQLVAIIPGDVIVVSE